MEKQISEIFRKSATRIKSIAFHPTNPVIITAHHCGTIHVWNLLYQQIIAVLREHTGSVRTVKIHRAGDIFATAGDDKLIRIWNYKTKQVINVLKGHTDYIRSIDFHPTKPWIVSGSDDCTISVWNFCTGEMLSSSSGHTHYVMSVLFLDSNHILSGSLDHTIALWKCSNLFEKKKFLVPDVILSQTIYAHNRGVNTLFLNDEFVMSGSDDREIKIWKYNNETLNLENVLYSHEGNVTAVFCKEAIFFGGSEDCMLSLFSNGRTIKLDMGARIWAISSRDEYLAIGTDDGLIVNRMAAKLACCTHLNNVYYTISTNLKKYNMKQSVDYCKVRENVKTMFFRDDELYVVYDHSFEVFSDGKKIAQDMGSIAFIGADKYSLKGENLYKNDELFRADITGVLYNTDSRISIVDNKTFTIIVDNKEISATYNFLIKSIASNGNLTALIGANKIIIVDSKMQILNTISELVEITGCIFHNDLVIYTTLKQLKFFYEDTGVLQSIDTYMIPVCVHDDYLVTITQKGIEKMLLNMSEIRFRMAVINDKDILSTIEEEHLPGLSPLEYLIKKNKGAIAFPFIKDDEKRFQLFMNDKDYENALQLCTCNKMFEELAFHSLKNGKYDITEICFKKTQDSVNLFYLYVCTKQLSKLEELEGEEIENMVKILLNDTSILKVFKGSENREGKKVAEKAAEKVTEKAAEKVKTDGSKKRIDGKTTTGNTVNDESKIVNNLRSVSLNSKSTNQSSNSDTESHTSLNKEQASSESASKKTIPVVTLDEKPLNDSSVQEDDLISSGSNLKTDQATLDDSDFQSQIFDLAEIEIPEEFKDTEYQKLYQIALNFTTQGKFSKAIEVFRVCISQIALKMSTPTEFLSMRKKIGNYLLGLQIEKSRRTVQSPEKSIQMSLFFASLELEAVHTHLVQNLAITTCFKNENLKTAYEIAEKYPDTKNSAKILSGEKGENKYEIPNEYLCYDSICYEKTSKECALCSVKSKEGEICGACKIGILH
ncbi:hypothetical protein GINT2_001921 [Glugoides intestinalis]